MEAVNILNSDEIGKIENIAIEELGISEELLMENAAYGTYNVIADKFREYEIFILCGPGNNGGDGLALGRILYSQGFNVTILPLFGNCYKSTAAKKNFNSAEKIGIITKALPVFNKSTLIVDAIFGIGLNREIDKNIKDIINTVNRSGAPILSIDIPSGINGNTGEITGKSAVKADITVTYIRPKPGHFLYPGADFRGELISDPISIPNNIIGNLNSRVYLNNTVLIPERGKNIHKTTYGRVLTIAGNKNYYGAPYFSSKSALLAGAGYSTLVTENSVIRSISSKAPEVIYTPADEFDPKKLNAGTVVIGPGIGLEKSSRELITKLLENSPSRIIIDGDGLTILSENIEILNGITSNIVLTPHPKEMARLLNTTVENIETDRINVTRRLSENTGAIVVLKGVYTLIGTPDGRIYINTISSNTLATAGSGDILCGIIAGMSGYTDILSAVRAAVSIHGFTGVIAEERIGSFGVSAENLMGFIPEAIKRYRSLKEQPSL